MNLSEFRSAVFRDRMIICACPTEFEFTHYSYIRYSYCIKNRVGSRKKWY